MSDSVISIELWGDIIFCGYFIANSQAILFITLTSLDPWYSILLILSFPFQDIFESQEFSSMLYSSRLTLNSPLEAVTVPSPSSIFPSQVVFWPVHMLSLSYFT